ncbi:hypothetical protein [Sphingorhabdus sp.]|uniref:hypothetical protein n=1 Tax=Sphingorhabdus sp. TaxID=1902408 RepID=UPI0032B81222
MPVKTPSRSPEENKVFAPKWRALQAVVIDDDQELADHGWSVIHSGNNGLLSKLFGAQELSINPGQPVLIRAGNFPGIFDDTEEQIESVAVHWLTAFEERLTELTEIASEEGVEISKASQKDARLFAQSLYNTARPGIFLVGNGNIRFVWTSDKKEQVGLQFRGKGKVQYVFFKNNEGQIEETMGTNKPIASITDFIALCGLRHVLSAQ